MNERENIALEGTAAQRHAAHMEQVRAVLRRSSLERVLSKIAQYEMWDRAATEGVQVGRYLPDSPPLGDSEREQLRHLRELRDAIRREMVEAGQIDGAGDPAGH